MTTPRGIIIFGANGSGKTTLGRELARILSFRHIDIEDYYFKKSDIPYSVVRPRDEYLDLMLADIYKHRTFVISAVTGDFGDIIPQFYELAVHLSAPHNLRMERIRQRTYDQHGKRVLKGGDMHEQTLQFLDFAASRPLDKIEQWADALTCPIIHIDGTKDLRANAADIAKQFYAHTKGLS